jgi:hypothetical protein
MNLLRNIVTDLVEKRLWPVAVGLGVLLVALPVALGRGGGEVPQGPKVAPLAGSEGGAVVRLAETPGNRARPDDSRNPFAQPTTASPNTGSASGAAPSASGGSPSASTPSSSGSGSSSSGGGSSVGDAGASPITTPGGVGVSVPSGAPKTDAKSKSGGAGSDEAFGVTLRFGEAGAMTLMKDLPRLSPLPSTKDPFIVFLGVGQDGTTAVFLVASDASVTGDGRCKPALSDCQTIELKAGETTYFDLDLGEGGVKQYQLDLVNVSKQALGSKALAAAAKARESSVGRQMLRTMFDADQVHLDELGYSQDRGTLVRRATSASAGDPGVIDAGYKVELRTGDDPRPRVEMDVKRLTALPTSDNPFLVFLGVLPDGQSVVFANPFEAAKDGGGTCLPDPEHCRLVQFKAGESAVFDLDPGEGKIAYRVGVDKIAQRKAATEQAAKDALRTESEAGREFLRAGIKAGVLDFQGLVYDAASGTLVKSAK